VHHADSDDVGAFVSVINLLGTLAETDEPLHKLRTPFETHGVAVTHRDT